MIRRRYALAKSFGIFNKMYTSSPTMSWPNHMFTQSGTSCGCTSTGPTFDKGGGPTKAYPQFTIYDSMALDNVSFGLYANATCGFGAHPPCTELSQACSIETSRFLLKDDAFLLKDDDFLLNIS